MIRLMAALCKTLLEFFTDEQIFQDASDGYIHHGKGCPRCCAIGQLGPYGGYFRWLVARHKRKTVSRRVWIRRFMCGSTHALLPDILTPRSVYSLRFKLAALIAETQGDGSAVFPCLAIRTQQNRPYVFSEKTQKNLSVDDRLSHGAQHDPVCRSVQL